MRPLVAIGRGRETQERLAWGPPSARRSAHQAALLRAAAEHPGALLAATPGTKTKRNGRAKERQRCAWHQFIVYKP